VTTFVETDALITLLALIIGVPVTIACAMIWVAALLYTANRLVNGVKNTQGEVWDK